MLQNCVNNPETVPLVNVVLVPYRLGEALFRSQVKILSLKKRSQVEGHHMLKLPDKGAARLKMMQTTTVTK